MRDAGSIIMRLDIAFVLGLLKLLKKFSLQLQRANLRVDQYYHLLELLRYTFQTSFKVEPMTPAAQQSYLEVYNNILSEFRIWTLGTERLDQGPGNWTLNQEL